MNTLDELHAECARAREAVNQAKIGLGKAIRSGDDKARKAGTKSLTDAEATVASLEAEIGAIEANDREAQRIAQEKAELEAAKQLQARRATAKADLAALRAKGAGIDKALDDLDEAVRQMDDAAREYLTRHKGLGLAKWFHDWVETRGWIRPFKAHMLYRSHPAIIQNLRNKYTDHAGGNTEANVPDFETVMGGTGKSSG